MLDRRSLLATAAWALPAGFLAFTGVSKLVSPEGTAPTSLSALLALAPWTTWLRIAGVLELLVAGLLAWPRSRSSGAYAGFALVAALSALLALNAADQGFVSNCGCMGAARLPAAGMGEVEALLLRNALLLLLLALGPYLRTGGPSTGGAFARAATAAGLVLLGLLYASERIRNQDAREERTALQHGLRRSGMLGWNLPALPVEPVDGAATTLDAWAQPLDHLLFVSTACEHCGRLGAHLGDLQREVEARRARLAVLVVGADAAGARAWLAANGYARVPAAALPVKRDAEKLGIDHVPAWIVLGADRRVAQHEAFAGPVSLAPRLASPAEETSLLLEFWRTRSGDLLGAGTRVGGLERQPDGSWTGTLEGPSGVLGRFVQRSDGSPGGLSVELALSLSPDGHILGLAALARGSLVPLLAPRLDEELKVLVGLSVTAALERAEKELWGTGLSAPAWRSVHSVLRGALPPAPPFSR